MFYMLYLTPWEHVHPLCKLIFIYNQILTPILTAPVLQSGFCESCHNVCSVCFVQRLAWEQQDPEDRKLSFLPQKFACLRAVPAYSRFIHERFERCLDLYLCPRQRKMRVRCLYILSCTNKLYGPYLKMKCPVSELLMSPNGIMNDEITQKKKKKNYSVMIIHHRRKIINHISLKNIYYMCFLFKSLASVSLFCFVF